MVCIDNYVAKGFVAVLIKRKTFNLKNAVEGCFSFYFFFQKDTKSPLKNGLSAALIAALRGAHLLSHTEQKQRFDLCRQ